MKQQLPGQHLEPSLIPAYASLLFPQPTREPCFQRTWLHSELVGLLFETPGLQIGLRIEHAWQTAGLDSRLHEPSPWLHGQPRWPVQ